MRSQWRRDPERVRDAAYIERRARAVNRARAAFQENRVKEQTVNSIRQFDALIGVADSRCANLYPNLQPARRIMARAAPFGSQLRLMRTR
jgi:hypothetical protein